jgi:hypothetical protein
MAIHSVRIALMCWSEKEKAMIEELKPNKCAVKFKCSANPFDTSECVYADMSVEFRGYVRCKYWENKSKKCTSLVAAVNAMTVKTKKMMGEENERTI